MAKDAASRADLTPRQQKWLASVRASLERDTGRTLPEWVAIARSCPETGQRARLQWLKDNYGLLQNHGMHVLQEAFPPPAGSEDPAVLRAALWTDPAGVAILEAIERAVAGCPDLVSGQRKGFTGWSRNFQFAAAKPLKGGGIVLGLAVPPDASPRLAPPRNEGWSERLKAKTTLARPAEVDAEIGSLLKAAWEKA